MTRVDRLRAEMKKAGIDGVLVLDELNQRYLSEFAFTDGFLAITLDRAYLVTDFRYYEMALNKASKQFEVMSRGQRRDISLSTLPLTAVR